MSRISSPCFSDLLQNPLIVPVKILKGHQQSSDGLGEYTDLNIPLTLTGILDCVFHPRQPWVFSAGADKTIRLFT